MIEDQNEAPGRVRRWLPTVFVSAVLVVALGLGIRLFTGGGDGDAEPAPEPTLEAVEYAPPVDAQPYEPPPPLDDYGYPLPQRVPVDIGLYPAPERGCGTEALPRLDPFCGNLSDRALTDAHIANYMVYLAAGLVAPGTLDAWPMSKDLTHWLRQVAATPVEDGGPDLAHEADYLEILDRWLADDYSTAARDYEFLGGVLGW